MNTDEIQSQDIYENNYLYVDSAIYKIEGISEDGTTLKVRDYYTNIPHELHISSLYTSGKKFVLAPSIVELANQLESVIKPPKKSPFRTTNELYIEKARKQIKLVEIVEKLIAEKKILAFKKGEKFRKTIVLNEDILPLFSIKKSEYYKYRNRYKKWKGNENAYAASLRRSTFGQTRLDPVTYHFLHTIIMQFFGRGSQLTPLRIYRTAMKLLEHTNNMWLDPGKCGGTLPDNILAELVDKNIPIEAILTHPEKAPLLSPVKLPDKSWFYEYLGYYVQNPENVDALYISRFGLEKYEQEYLVFNSFVHKTKKPLEAVFLDHYLMDVFIVDRETRSVPVRLWLTMIIDAYTRCIIGFSLSSDNPNIASVQSALKHAIYPKPDYSSLGIHLPYIQFGMMQFLFLDNAWPHHSYSLENLIRGLGKDGYQKIVVVHRPPYLARYGALIERFFGSLSLRLKEEFAGFGAIVKPKDYESVRDAAKQACLLYEDIYKFIVDVIVSYHNTPHRELGGMTPQQKWLTGFNLQTPQEMVHLLKTIPPLTPEIEHLFLREYHEKRTIKNKKVELWGYRFAPFDVDEFNKLPRVDRQNKLLEYSIRFDEDDVSIIHLFYADSHICDLYCEDLVQADGSLISMSLWELKMKKRAENALFKLNEGELPKDFWEDYLRQQELKKRRRTEKKDVQKKLQRDEKVTEAKPNSPLKPGKSHQNSDSDLTADIISFLEG